jgi:hypothetical protein
MAMETLFLTCGLQIGRKAASGNGSTGRGMGVWGYGAPESLRPSALRRTYIHGTGTECVHNLSSMQCTVYIDGR